jgi:hypothetical protein
MGREDATAGPGAGARRCSATSGCRQGTPTEGMGKEDGGDAGCGRGDQEGGSVGKRVDG